MVLKTDNNKVFRPCCIISYELFICALCSRSHLNVQCAYEAFPDKVTGVSTRLSILRQKGLIRSSFFSGQKEFSGACWNVRECSNLLVSHSSNIDAASSSESGGTSIGARPCAYPTYGSRRGRIGCSRLGGDHVQRFDQLEWNRILKVH